VLVPVRLIAQPGDSEIRLDGQLVGTGRFSGVFSPGERLSFVVSHRTRGEEQLDVTVGADRGRTYRVSLAERAPASDEENDPESEPAVDTDGDADTGPESNTVDNPPLPEQARRTDAGNPSDAVTQSGSAPAGPEATAPPRRAQNRLPAGRSPPFPPLSRNRSPTRNRRQRSSRSPCLRLTRTLSSTAGAPRQPGRNGSFRSVRP
jgi:hypothetical protein